MAKEKEPCCWRRQVGETEVKQEDLKQVSTLLRELKTDILLALLLLDV